MNEGVTLGEIRGRTSQFGAQRSYMHQGTRSVDAI